MVINFPSDITSRTEKIKKIQEKKNKPSNKANQININAQASHKPVPKFTITVSNISELSKNIECMDDTLKYVTDCVYDFSVALEKFRKSLLFMFVASLIYMPVYYFLTRF